MPRTSPPIERLAHAIRRFRTVSQIDRVLQVVSRPRFRAPAPIARPGRPILLYSPANLNQVDGSTIWTRSAAETLLTDPRVHVTIPLRNPIRRSVVTGALARDPRVELIDIHPRIAARQLGLSTTQSLDLIERLDRTRPFDALILRSYALCERAIERTSLHGRLWSTYILEPERDTDDPEYRAGMGRIAAASRHVVVQSEGMRRLLESVVPEARGRTILLPPGIPPGEQPRAPADRTVRRLLYTGKFHPFYPVELMVESFVELRREIPDLEFHVAGDKFMPQADDPGYVGRIERLLRTTPGLVWHGSLSREATSALLAEGGVALSLWDYRHGPRMNDLVISTKLLDYAAAGIPIVLTRTETQVELLGATYPLFADELGEGQGLIRRVLLDPDLYRSTADQVFTASRAYTYPAIHALVAPYLDEAARRT